MSFCLGRARLSAGVRNVVGPACCGVVPLLPWGCAWGQTPVDGEVSGFVVDATGAALKGAVVQVRNLANGLTAVAKTEGRGEFVVAHLPAGDYRVVVAYERFANLTLEPVVVEVGGVTSVEARLKVGGIISSVNVTAVPEPPATVSVDEVASTATSSVVTPEEMERTPVNGRRWQAFALLTPTVNADPEGMGC
ncbi:carboxypeptidase-like regulatory domain-containing protein [Tunturiibacter empetritectus]|uniref:carboxypeptidase-like regulatory domain-containing protein n=1 Tax=Tunturiibacter empetritectus TaxID=3069691 RepID=UPI003D9BC31A